jgi:serine/threonine protein kinase
MSQSQTTISAPLSPGLELGYYSYNEHDLLGSGYSSKVYKATRIDNPSQLYAIKAINTSQFDAASLSLLDQEIKVHQSLSHPNIVKFHDSFRTATHCYIVMEYCPHGDLLEFLTRHRTIDEKKALNIIQQVIKGYSHLIEKGVLHRDLKPANIFRCG